MNKELIKVLAKRLQVGRQTEWYWLKLGLSQAAKDELLKNGTFHRAKGNYFINYLNESYILQPSVWGELKGLKELRASVKLLKDKERKSQQLQASKKTKTT